MIRENNFDLIRLFAALQVLLGHAVSHLNVPHVSILTTFLSYLPGVPIFFVISGFLISMSWERSPSMKTYIVNRVLRIYPALWVCLIFTVAMILCCGVRPDSAFDMISWMLAQVSFIQFFNPDFLRGFGVGVVNGSLWTIPVELQFYAILPLLIFLANRYRFHWIMLIIIALIMVLSRNYIDGNHIINKLMKVSLFPYLFFFAVGVFLRKLHEKYSFLFYGKALLWMVVYAGWVLIERIFKIENATGNQLNIVSIILLGAAIVSVAFTSPDLSLRLLKGNDVSYGVYIWHMPIINLLIYNQLIGFSGFFLALSVTFLMALISWILVEKPALGLKRYSLRERG